MYLCKFLDIDKKIVCQDSHNTTQNTSTMQAAILADAMAERLGIKEKWKVFEGLWHRKYMRSDYNLALTRKKTLDFLDKLKQLFG